ncbi:hypothetical protein [Lysobacter sp. CFH 32150]|uniref:hypothetical protein n=1 Tax=Lysobacter sp. CFH 32150 TaxID=2927128 RepID=UPI001FA72A79|nr:hypothetical protein [Lysobacter sp. CFH 32150]MCI4569314.1 hypothetical protein [Lysobacter sp. CFH 32150]
MKQAGTWHAGIGMYSGRPDPIWGVSAQAVQTFEAIWDSLEPSSERARVLPAPLGYRGCFVKADDVQWECYRGVGKLVRPGVPDQFRLDPERQLEWWIVRSAPQGVLPDNVAVVLGLET